MPRGGAGCRLLEVIAEFGRCSHVWWSCRRCCYCCCSGRRHPNSSCFRTALLSTSTSKPASNESSRAVRRLECRRPRRNVRPVPPREHRARLPALRPRLRPRGCAAPRCRWRRRCRPLRRRQQDRAFPCLQQSLTRPPRTDAEQLFHPRPFWTSHRRTSCA